ncbi:MAG: Flp pilus assembly complex ATPase component TadA [Sandaracinaceae bacterium]|jgi:pilus assembly protein CpaF|nr:Flp pilus assembly complex ATPase component TadA [Sandaracinaceae bacterium]
MFTLVITEKGGAQRKLEFDKPEITIGRVTGNDIVLPKGNVSKRHSRIVLKDGRYIVVDLKSTNGTYVNGRKITSPLVIKQGDKVYIGDFIISLDGGEAGAEAGDAAPPMPEEAPRPVAPPVRPVSVAGAVAPRPPGPPAIRSSNEIPVQPRQSIPQPAPPAAPQAPRLSSVPPPPPLPPVSSESVVESLDDDDDDVQPTPMAPRPVASPTPVSQPSASIPRTQESPAKAPAPMQTTPAAQPAARVATSASQVKPMAVMTPMAKAAPVTTNSGGDPIDTLTSDARVQEILIEAPGRIVVDVGMGLEEAPFTYPSVAALNKAIQRVFTAAGASIDQGAAVYETSGEAWNVYYVSVPSSASSPMLVLRRVAREFVGFDALVARGTVAAEDVEGLKTAVYERRNILVTGPSTRAVSPVLGALGALAAERERVVAIETAPSMGIPRALHLYLSAKTGENFRDALQKARLLRADRIVIEEIEGGEAYDALVAMAGRRGSLASVFAGSGAEALGHLQLLVSLDGRVSAENAQVLVQRAVALVVHVDLDDSGNPVIHEIATTS